MANQQDPSEREKLEHTYLVSNDDPATFLANNENELLVSKSERIADTAPGLDADYAGTGVSIATGFDLKAPKPLDARIVKKTYDEMNAIPNVERYAGMQVFVLDDWLLYRLNKSNNWIVEDFQFSTGETDPTSSIGYEGWMYLNTSAGTIWRKEADASGNVVWVSKFIIPTGVTGRTGDQGIRGTKWWSGDAITGGSSVVDQVFSSSGITEALVDDYYLNSITTDVYKCTASGGSLQATWSFVTNLRGTMYNTHEEKINKMYAALLANGTITE